MSDTPTPTIDTARLPVLLTQLRLPNGRPALAGADRNRRP